MRCTWRKGEQVQGNKCTKSGNPVIVKWSELRLLHKDSLGDSIAKVHVTQCGPHTAAPQRALGACSFLRKPQTWDPAPET